MLLAYSILQHGCDNQIVRDGWVTLAMISIQSDTQKHIRRQHRLMDNRLEFWQSVGIDPTPVAHFINGDPVRINGRRIDILISKQFSCQQIPTAKGLEQGFGQGAQGHKMLNLGGNPTIRQGAGNDTFPI